MYYLIIRDKFILSSISNGWLFWSVNHSSIAWNCESNILKRYDFEGKFLIYYQIVYVEQMYARRLNVVDNQYWQYRATSVISNCVTFSSFLSLVVLFSVLPSNFIVSGVKSSS